MNNTIPTTCVMHFCLVLASMASVPTAEEYAHALETQFTNGMSSASIRASFETNGLYTIYDILPYCYDYAVNTNDLEGSVSRYKAKLAFIDTIMPEAYLEFSSNTIAQTVIRLSVEHGKLVRSIRKQYEENKTPENLAHWRQIYPQAVLGAYSGRAERAMTLREARVFTKSLSTFFRNFMLLRPCYAFDYILHVDSYAEVFSRDDLCAELSTNTQFNADAMFKYCQTGKSDFATNNIAIAEKQIWRNNFVLDIVRHSCNLHTNETNRALNTVYTNRLAILRAYYEAIPEPHLGMIGAELDEWRTRLGNTIDAYTNGISPFRSPEQGD